jgi:hypothetical protein
MAFGSMSTPRGDGVGSVPSPRHGPILIVHGSEHSRFGRGFEPQPILWGGPWYGDYGLAGTAPPQPAVVIVQAPPSPSAPPEEASPARPLFIEWRGDRFVRFGGTSKSTDPQLDYSESAAVKPAASTPTDNSSSPVLARQPSPVVLVYRDGHREQLAGYTIASGVIYARGDYWTDGYWVKSILVAALDLPATYQANLNRGVNFVLPSAPNEVVVGP